MAACRDQALALVGDTENCHLFYRCDMLDTATPQVTHWAVELETKVAAKFYNHGDTEKAPTRQRL